MFYLTNNHLGFTISHLNRPLRSGLNEFAEDACGLVVFTHGLAVVAPPTISTKKVGDQLPANLQKLIWPSSRSLTCQQIRVTLVSLAHQSYLACIRPSYCCARQKFGLSISAGSFIALVSS